MKTRTRATKVHYSRSAFVRGDVLTPICKTFHGKTITLTEKPELVTCLICKFHVGLHRPVKDTTAKPIAPEVGHQLTLGLENSPTIEDLDRWVSENYQSYGIIQRIVAMRKITGCSLKDGKTYVEGLKSDTVDPRSVKPHF